MDSQGIPKNSEILNLLSNSAAIIGKTTKINIQNTTLNLRFV